MKKIVAITSCSTGIAHTYMAAEALKISAEELGYQIKVETQGSIGAENVLTDKDIEEADVVIVSANTGVNLERFIGKKVLVTTVEEGVNEARKLIERSFKDAKTHQDASVGEKVKDNTNKVGVYRHLMAGVSYMIPFVVAGGILIALGFAFGGINNEGAIAQALNTIGGGTAFALMLPVLAGYIAFSIADRPGLTPGMIGGMLANSIGAGFLGAVFAGFLAGYTALFLKKTIKLPKGLEGLLPVLVLPLLSSAVVGLAVIFILGTPFTAINNAMTSWLNSLSGANSLLLGAVLGGMMAIDLAGPIGKAAYFFGVASLTAITEGQTSMVMAAVMASGMIPPLSMALATIIAKNKFSNEEKEAGKTAWILGLSFISEGAIPFAAADPLRVLPSVVVGSAVTGILSMAFQCGLAVPHGGLFVLPIPGAVTNLIGYLIAIAVGTIVGALMVCALKKKKN